MLIKYFLLIFIHEVFVTYYCADNYREAIKKQQHSWAIIGVVNAPISAIAQVTEFSQIYAYSW